MMRLGWFLLALCWSRALFALPAEPLQPNKRLVALCEALNARLLSPTTVFFAEIEGLYLAPYDPDRAVLPLVGVTLSGLSGALSLKTSPVSLETSVSPEGAKLISALALTDKLTARAAFRIRTDAEIPCEATLNTDGTPHYNLAVEILAVELLRRINNRPLLRYETAAYTASRTKSSRLDILVADPVVSEGSVTPQEVQDATNKRSDALRRCYADAVRTNPNAQGTLTIRFQIASAGTPSALTVAIDTLGNPDASRCAVDVLGQTVFPAPAYGSTEVSLTLYFLQR